MMKNELNLFYYCVFVTLIFVSKGYTNSLNNEESTEKVINSFYVQKSETSTSFEDAMLNDNSGCNCGPNSEACWRNSTTNYGQECKCKKGYAPKLRGKDEFCEECNCGEFSQACNFDILSGRQNCTCTKGYGPKLIHETTGEQTCERCDCGTNGVNCMILQGGEKMCFCQFGNYKTKFVTTTDDKCKECDCGPQSISCGLYDTKRQFCECKPGYVSDRYTDFSNGEFCEPCDCGEHGKCSVKVVENRSVQECTCNAGYKEYKGKCKKCDCGSNSLNCELYKYIGTQICECKEGYGSRKRHLEEDEYCEKCDCGEFGETCTYNFGYRNCTCKEGYTTKDGSVFRDDTLCEKPCDCGIFGKCKVPLVDSKSIKECVCDPGYVPFEGRCRTCECGSKSVSCDFNPKGIRICKCVEGYSSEITSENDIYETCTKCDCGEHGKCEAKVVENRSVKECKCESGYQDINGKCKKCDCGLNALKCTFHNSTGNRICDCKIGYSTKQSYLYKDEYCESCDCGERSVSCKFEFGIRICTCEEGYSLSTGDTKDYCKKGSSLGGVMIAFIAIAVILVVVVVGVVILKIFIMPSRQH